MIRSIKALETSLNESKSKMKSDIERSLRGLNFGKLYLKNGEYETAIRYVNEYLSVRPNSSEAYKLLAQINEAVGDHELALINYRKSLELRKQSNDSYSFVTPTKTPSFPSPGVTTSSPMLNHSNSIDNNRNNTPIKEYKETSPKTQPQLQPQPQPQPPQPQPQPQPQSQTPSVSHSCGICSNQNLLHKIAKQQEDLMETNKIILDIIKQNNANISDIQQQMVTIHESLNILTDTQNVLKDTLYDYVSQEHEDFEDYDPDEKENDTLNACDILNTNNSQSSQWQSPSVQLNPQLDQTKPLSELFKPPANSWLCEVCYVQNDASQSTCLACTSPNPTAIPVQPQTNQSFTLNSQPFSFQPPFTSSTTGFNFGGVDTSSSLFSNSTFKFGNMSNNDVSLPSFNSNSFLESAKQTDQSPQNIFSASSKINGNNGVTFQFGSSQNFSFKFPESTPKEDTFKSPKSGTGLNLSIEKEDDTEHPEPSNADNIYFQPVVPLPPKVEVKTGEEEEKILYSCRARLFRFSASEWKERGVGELKILLSPESNRVRMVMRRDTVLKVCLNQYITPELKLDLKEDKKSITWSAIDYSEDSPAPEVFLLRLKNSENAELFLDAFKDAQLLLKAETVSDEPKVVTVSDKTQAKSVSDKTEVEKVSEKPKVEKVADKPKVEAISDKSKTEIVPVDSKIETVSGKSQENNAPNVVDDDIEVVYIKMPKSEELLKKTIELKLPLNFYDYLDEPPCPGCRGCNDEVPLNPVRQLNNESLTNQVQNTVQESLFSSAIAASNVNQTNWQANANKPSWLVNTPSPIFSSESKERNADDDDDTVVANPDIYFKPVIPLPELIEVKTGEEDEELIYCQRAKLYRFDPALKEWKERGIGDFKILKHKDKSRYRMILRRDQILKIACNHYINSSMSLNPMNTSETAVCWYAVDFSDGNAVEEQFAVKFKNKELLQEFIKVFNRCKSELENNDNSFNLNNSTENTDQNYEEGDEDTDAEEDQE